MPLNGSLRKDKERGNFKCFGVGSPSVTDYILMDVSLRSASAVF